MSKLTQGQTILQNLQTMNAQNQKKTSGIGYVWDSLTGAVGDASGVVSSAATSARVVADAGLVHAASLKLGACVDLCKTLEVPADDPLQAVNIANELVLQITKR